MCKNITIIPKKSQKKYLSLFFLLLLVSVIPMKGFGASVPSQKFTMDLQMEQESFETILKEIKRKSKYKVLYPSDLFDGLPKMSIDVKDASISDILNELIVPFGFEYVLKDQTIIFKEKVLIPVANRTSAADPIDISGVIVDDVGEPLPGANILIKGTSTGTVSDINGKYTLSAPIDAVLVVSFLGFVAKEIPIEGRSVIDVVLQPDVSSLEEIVVVGYGEVKKSDLTGAVGIVDTDGFDKMAGTSPLNAMQGRAAGVVINSNSGLPGSGFNVTVRGINSINTGNGGGSSPIYVVDGVITNSIDNISQNNIESISILKDASASAIYGARSANGVILVTTKRGTVNVAPQITFNAYVGLSNEGNLRHELLNADQFLELWTEAYENSNLPLDWDQNDLAYYEGVDTNWKDLMLQQGFIQSYDVSVSGGSEKSNYFVAANLVDQEGMVIGTGQKKYTFQINTDHKIRDWFKFGNSLNISSNKILGDQTYYRKALTKVPLTRNKEDDGDWGKIYEPSLEHFFVNPIWEAENSSQESVWKGLQGNLYITITPVKNLEFTVRGNLNYAGKKQSDFVPGIPPQYGWGGTNVNTVYKEFQENVYWSNDYLLRYKLDLEQHQLSFLAGYSREENSSEVLYGQRTGTINNEIRYLDAGDPTSQINGNNFRDWSLVSMFGRVNYSFRDKFLFTGTIRRDGTSRLTKENRWGVFPSGSVAWKISEESFLNTSSWIDELKLRASYGTLGNVNSIGIYGTSAALEATRAVSNNLPALGYTLTSAINQNVTWESAKKANVGVDLTTHQGRYYTTIDYFVDNTYDMLFAEPIPRSSGLSGSPVINGGNVRNKGIELVVGARGRNSSWYYDASLNFSHIKNEVIDLAGRDEITLGASRISYKHQIGAPAHSFFGYKSNGLIREESELEMYKGGSFPTKKVGDIAIVDINGYDAEGNLTGAPDGKINEADRTLIGNRYPKFFYGGVISGGYKSFGLAIQLQGSHGADEFFGPGQSTDLFQLMTSFAQNEDVRLIDRYHPTKNPEGNFPLLNKNGSGGNEQFSDFWLENASYLRIQNVTFSYDLPQGLLSKAKIENLGLYLSVQNAYTFTKNHNPEVGNATASGSGMNATVTGVPVPRTVSFGVKAAF
ncbi:SusC/RagA family TonB-linked outer membrane protein [Algoriphagus resistens]|uniref:SusC/RagA family TonB-linked outer membrane protein n=1 Tax=Algoriphagus resistens TaxID=1750590 RepID=UPI00071683F8|nr:TonB-dependent receptor [Algoriphagus resistens]